MLTTGVSMKRILIVEDDVPCCLALSDMLNEFGFETGVADCLSRALNILEMANPLPDIILLDMEMPNGEGTRLLELIKHHSTYCAIQIVEMSNNQATPTSCGPQAGIYHILQEAMAVVQ